MACVKFLLLALAYMCSNEVKQRCVGSLQLLARVSFNPRFPLKGGRRGGGRRRGERI